MTIEMPKALPFSVDTWTPSSMRKPHHFLTHAHMDHLQAFVANASYPTYCTLITRTLLLQFFSQERLDLSIFIRIEVGQSLVLEDQDGDFIVTALDANHCPGAVMFLFEGKFGNILHTGDCRLTPEYLQSLPCKYIGKKGKPPSCQLDCIFLDCTFGKFRFDMPSKHQAIRQVINCIWEHPDARTVYLTCDLLGHEEILVEVSRAFGEKIYVDKAKNWKCFKHLELISPEIVSQDPSSRFQLFGFRKLYDKAEAKISEARANLQPEPLIIRPSSQWYLWDEGISDTIKRKKERIDQATRDLCGIWHVCYSMHSSRDELEWALQLLAPKWVVSTTPGCRAVELDYVQKHCFNNRQAVREALLNLLDMEEVSSLSDESSEVLECSHVTDYMSDNSTETICEPVVISTHQRKRLSLSPPERRPMVTLFGRARLGFHDFETEHEQKGLPASIYFPERVSTETGEHEQKGLPASFDLPERVTTETDEHEQKGQPTSFVLPERVSTETGEHEQKGLSLSIDLPERVSTETGEHEQTALPVAIDLLKRVSTETGDTLSGREDVNDMKFEVHGNTNTAKSASDECTYTGTATGMHKLTATSSISLSYSYSENMRKLYRSLNVPVPQRLPSLVKLMNGTRAIRKRL